MGLIETIKKRLEAYIEVTSVDSVTTHLRQIFLFASQDKICGSSTQNEIKVWISTNRVIGAFYPVVQLKFNENQNKIVLNSKMNKVGFYLALLINIAILWSALNMFILREGLTTDSILQRLLVFVVFIGIFNFPIYMSYRKARDVIIQELEAKVRNI